MMVVGCFSKHLILTNFSFRILKRFVYFIFVSSANESGVITLWNIPSEGLTEIVDKPTCRLVGVYARFVQMPLLKSKRQM